MVHAHLPQSKNHYCQNQGEQILSCACSKNRVALQDQARRRVKSVQQDDVRHSIWKIYASKEQQLGVVLLDLVANTSVPPLACPAKTWDLFKPVWKCQGEIALSVNLAVFAFTASTVLISPINESRVLSAKGKDAMKLYSHSNTQSICLSALNLEPQGAKMP